MTVVIMIALMAPSSALSESRTLSLVLPREQAGLGESLERLRTRLPGGRSRAAEPDQLAETVLRRATDEVLDERLEALVGPSVGVHEGAGLRIGDALARDADAALQHQLRRGASGECHADGRVADDWLAALVVDAEQEDGFRDREVHAPTLGRPGGACLPRAPGIAPPLDGADASADRDQRVRTTTVRPTLS